MISNVIKFSCNDPVILQELHNAKRPFYMKDVLGEPMDKLCRMPPDGEVKFTVENQVIEGELTLFPNNHATINDLHGDRFYLCGVGRGVRCVGYRNFNEDVK